MAPDALGHLEVWFVAGSQEMYGEQTLRQVDEHAREMSGTLDGAEQIPVRVVCKPVLTAPGSIRELCLEANAAPECVGLITWMHTFSPAKMWVNGSHQLTKPLLAHLHTQYNRELPWSEIDMGFMNLNQSAHGDREYGFILARLRLDRKIVVGHWQDSAVIAELDSWSRSPARLAESRRLKIVRFGGMNMREVAVTGGDRSGGADPAGMVDERLRRGRSGRADRRRARRRGRPARRGVRGAIHAGRRAAPGRRQAREPALRGPDRRLGSARFSPTVATAPSRRRSRTCTG